MSWHCNDYIDVIYTEGLLDTTNAPYNYFEFDVNFKVAFLQQNLMHLFVLNYFE